MQQAEQSEINDIEERLLQRIPNNYTIIQDKESEINIERILKHDPSTELVLFELPKGFDRSNLEKIKIKNFGSNGKITRIFGDYQGICFDNNHPVPLQTHAIFMKKDKRTLMFKKFDRYVKVFENIDFPSPDCDSVIPRRLILKKRTSKAKNKSNKK